MWVLLCNLHKIQRQTQSSSDDHCSCCQHKSKFHKTQGEANIEHVETAEDIGAGFVFKVKSFPAQQHNFLCKWANWECVISKNEKKVLLDSQWGDE